ncbi:MAG: hypothetical protein H6977_21050 [Gammaproteobacteria bacterium]|nr:hypothetical protein [Gammaproteobacteria bacterium]
MDAAPVDRPTTPSARPRRLEAMCRRLFALALWALVARTHAAPLPFTFTAPDTLRAAQISRAAIGNTYAYLAADPAQPLRLTITVMAAGEVEARFGALDTAACVNPFLDELGRNHAHFFAVAQARPLVVAGHELPQFRWTGERRGRTLTGIVACGRLDHAYYIVDFVDALGPSTTSFPDLRSRLRELAPAAPATR